MEIQKVKFTSINTTGSKNITEDHKETYKFLSLFIDTIPGNMKELALGTKITNYYVPAEDFNLIKAELETSDLDTIQVFLSDNSTLAFKIHKLH